MLTTHSTYSANQAEHLESLLLSHLSMTHANYAKAVAALHAKLLQPFERWCAHTAVVDGEAEVRPELGRTNAWLRPDTPELLREIGLYLLLWGEAANLRFMPEMLCFLFELARSSSAIQSLRLQTFKGAPAATAAATAAAAAVAAPEEGTFLRNVVVPIYNVVVGETSSGVDAKGRPKPLEGAERPSYPKNYDDWNQAFWSCSGLLRLRTRRGGTVMAAPPAGRWEMLPLCDWGAFLRGARKSHTELRWWWCLLAANRRIFELHAWGMLLCIFAAMPRDDGTFDGWGTLRLLPAALLIAPLGSAGGRLFESWSDPCERTASAWRNAAAGCGLLCLLAIVVIWAQLNMSFPEFELEPLLAPRSLLLLGSYFPLVGFGLGWLLLELLPQSPPPNAFDSFLLFERRTKKLWQQRWLVPATATAKGGGMGGSVGGDKGGGNAGDKAAGRCGYALHPQLKAMARLYSFWGAVWLVKLLFGSLLLMPTLLDAHNALEASFPIEVLAATRPALGWTALVGLALEPSLLLRIYLQLALWAAGATFFLADTLLVYQIVLAVWGGVAGLAIHGVGRSGAHWSKRDVNEMRGNAITKVLPPAVARRGAQEAGQAWQTLWAAVVDDLHTGDLLSEAEAARLVEDQSHLKGRSVHNPEARRRLHFFARSLSSSAMGAGGGPLTTAGLTVLVPHYSEQILVSEEELRAISTNHRGRAQANQVGFLVSYFSDEWANFVVRARKVQRSVEAQDWAVGLAKTNATKFSCSEQTLFQALSSASASSGAPLAAGWEELADDHGTAYYHHADSGVSQWERPGGGASASASASASAPPSPPESPPDIDPFAGEEEDEVGQLYAPAGHDYASEGDAQAESLLLLRQWASARLQTLYRTVSGMMKARRALELLLRLELPELPEPRLQQLLDAKFRCVVAVQRYVAMD